MIRKATFSVGLVTSLLGSCVLSFGAEAKKGVTTVPTATPAQADVLEPAKPNATDKVNVKLTELFGTEETPGSGSIGYSVGPQLQKIALGKESGVYALGLVFENIDLPAQLKKNKLKQAVIQLAIGVNRSKLAGQVPQFAAMTILSNDTPQLRKVYPLVVPNPGDKNRKEMAFLLFTPPTTPAERTDEDKLKTTFFANGGKIALTPYGGTQSLDAKRNGDRLKFNVRFYEAEIDGDLVTPFHTEPGKIQAKFKFPLYWPANEAARRLVQRMAQDSLDGANVEKVTGRSVAGER